MSGKKIAFLFLEQRKLTLASLFLYLVFAGIGYAGLSKTAILYYLRDGYLVLMISASVISILLTMTTPKNRSAVSYILLTIFQLLPALLGTLCLIAVSLGNISKLNDKVILSYLCVYIVFSTIYVFFVHARNIWQYNLNQKKYDLKEGVFYPAKHNHSKAKKNNRWVADILLLMIVISVMIFKLAIFSEGFKFYVIGGLSVIVSFYFLRFIVGGFFYPLIRLMLWEKYNKKKFMIGV